MKAYYGSRFSPNMTKTPEGFLICHNVPIARTGWYEYLGKELGLTENGNEIIKVYRSDEEVFNEKAMASFNGKIVTDNHPPDLLTPENAQRYSKGAVQNVRRSKKETDLLLADLFIHDKRLIKEIEDGKREVSCGYDCIYVDNEDGTYSQTCICGNHVAVVDSGRAGNRVAIKDSNKKEEGAQTMKIKLPRKNSTITRTFAAMGLKQFAIDADPEEIADVVDEMAEENKANDNTEEVKEEKKPTTEANDDEETSKVEVLSQQVAKLTQLVEQLVVKKEKSPEESIDEMIEELSKNDKSTGDEEESVTIPVDEMDEGIPGGVVQQESEKPKNPIPNADSDMMIRALKAIKPVIANMSNVEEKKKACDSLKAEFNKVVKAKSKSKDNNYEQIIQAQNIKAKKNIKTADQKQEEAKKIGEDLKKKFNPHYKEEK